MSVRAVACILAFLCGAAAAQGNDPERAPVPRTEPRLARGYRLPSPEVREFGAGNWRVRLYAQSFSQGNAVYAEIVPAVDTVAPGRAVALFYNDIPVHLSSFSRGYRGLFPVPPDDPPGEKTVTLVVPDSGAHLSRHIMSVVMEKTRFPVSRSKLDAGKYSDVNHARDPRIQGFIAECSRKKRQAFARLGPDRLGGPLAHPRCTHYVTSPFWSTRIYERFEIRDGKRIELPPSEKIHRGIDLRGTRGEPVFALAGGEVILAEKMYYEGNFTVIDHGNRVMSYYMHQDSLLVQAGQLVAAGDTIGTVGSSGVSTAPHLHVSLTIDGVQVDPLSILPLPIRGDMEE